MSGNKQELVDRLQQAESSALLDDDLDHEDEQISEEAIKAAEEELKKQTDLNTSDEPSPAKKLKTSDVRCFSFLFILISIRIKGLTFLPIVFL